MSNLPSGTKYELVLGFDYTPITFNNNVGFEVGGKRYYIEGSEHKRLISHCAARRLTRAPLISRLISISLALPA